MEFVDRVSAYPNRYTMTDGDGNVSYIVLERADDPITTGTPLNAETFNSLFLCTENADHPGCYYRTVGDETEWLNPPMVPGVEYRTIKRHNSKPVYAKLLIAESLGAGTTYLSIGKFDYISCQGHIAYAVGDYGVFRDFLPAVKIDANYDDVGSVWATFRIQDSNIRLLILSETTEKPYTATFVLEYTK